MSTDPRLIRLIMDLRQGNVVDTAVLSAVERVPRHLFVDPPYVDRAYENSALPIGCGQTISQPLIVALMLQALQTDKKIKVLEIGTGSGYQTAILSHLFRRVYSIDLHRPLIQLAEQRFRELNITNITTRCGDGYLGWPEQTPFERIIVSAAAPVVPEKLIAQLAEGGILVIPVGFQDGEQWVMKITKKADGLIEEKLWPVQFVPMVSAA